MFIYEVNIQFEPAIREKLAAWLPQHMADMLETGCFYQANWYQETTLDCSDETTITSNVHNNWTVCYKAKTLQNIRKYFHEWANKLRGDGAKAFSNHMKITRRILQRKQQTP